jgi:hypothetical protein
VPRISAASKSVSVSSSGMNGAVFAVSVNIPTTLTQLKSVHNTINIQGVDMTNLERLFHHACVMNETQRSTADTGVDANTDCFKRPEKPPISLESPVVTRGSLFASSTTI